MTEFEHTATGKLTGLVVCGGKSSRMGFDKCMISYHGRPECYRVYQLLENFCSEVYLSCNDKQTELFDAGYFILPDLPDYRDIGPMAALLTACSINKNNSLLVIGCDYPFLHSIEIVHIINHAEKSKLPVAYFNEFAGKYEPLLAWYPASSCRLLTELYAAGRFSLNEFLELSNTVKLTAADPLAIKSIDTSEEYLHAMELMKHTYIH